jgi:uncharacterized membrane protein
MEKLIQAIVIGLVGAAAVVVIMLVIGTLYALPVMWIWNYMMPELFGLPVIHFWQAFWGTTLCGLLFKSQTTSTLYRLLSKSQTTASSSK